MYLKKLEMLGFKSFADRTEFSFKPGMTGIVGPNGCGKSNVVDAFKWILGSQSAKGLRGSEMKDVIFNGTQSRKPAGFAEVTVVFDNQDSFLDLDYSEVAVTRRLFRSGESEYLINKQKCRLKDIRELFLDTGMGQTSYSILEQGKIDVLLQSSPLDRRVIFEEAAGISRYRVRKAETLRALMRVEDNLNRLQDIVDEVEKQIRRVKTQATKAKRYREYSERLKELRVRTALDDFHRSMESGTDLSFGLYWANHRLSRLEDLEGRLQVALTEQLERRQDLLEKMKDRRERMSAESSARERVQERIEQSRRRLQELAESRVRKQEDLEETVRSIDGLRRRIEEEDDRRSALAAELERGRDRLDEARDQLSEKQEEHGRRQEELRLLKEQVVGVIQRRARIANHVVQVSSELKNLNARKERLENTVAGLRAELGDAARRHDGLQGQLDGLAAESETIEGERARISEDLSELEGEIGDLEDALAGRQEDLHRRSSRLDVLRSFEERLDGVASGVVEVLKRKEELPPLARYPGILASLLRVDRRYARAVEAALGDRAQSLVVETQEGALQLLDFVKGDKLGAVEVIALERVDRIAPEYFPRQGGVVGPLRDAVEVSEGLDELIDRLLANVVLVEDLATAVALSRNGLRPFRLVTLAGEVIEPWGGLSVCGDAETGIISRLSEMEELKVEVGELEKACDGLRRELSDRRRRLGERSEHLRARTEAAEDVNRKVIGIRGEAAQVERDRERVEREIQVSASEIAELDGEIRERLEDRAEREAEACAVDREREETEEGIRRLEAALADSAREVDQSADAVSSCRLELARAEKQEEGLRQLLEQQSRNLSDRERQAGDVRDEIATLDLRGRETQEVLNASGKELEEARQRERSLAEELAELERQDGSVVEVEKCMRHEIDKVRSRCAQLRREREELQLRDQEERHRRNAMLQRIDEQYGIDLRALLERAGGTAPSVARMEPGDADGDERFLTPLPDWNDEEARGQIKELQQKIQRLGNVNLEALDELEELEERHEFQLAQRDDLVDSRRNLHGIINDINRKSREMFLDTFGKVQQCFGELFRKCFGGGRAELVLDENADVLEAGIEIIARPPGKKLTSLSLMSGGEKTMTTIALLLAIFRSRPSPFCILDEVDAALDDANVGRFVVLLQEFIEQSQFVIVTHNKLTMAEASTLYGVTMQERGASKKVAVELETYDPERMEMSATGLGAGGG